MNITVISVSKFYFKSTYVAMSNCKITCSLVLRVRTIFTSPSHFLQAAVVQDKEWLSNPPTHPPWGRRFAPQFLSIFIFNSNFAKKSAQPKFWSVVWNLDLKELFVAGVFHLLAVVDFDQQTACCLLVNIIFFGRC